MVFRINVPFGNLRAAVIVIVVAFHSVLPDLASQPARRFPFDAPPYREIAFPIIDQHSWFGFDLRSAGAICLFAMCSQLMRSRHHPLDSLSAHAYNIYLVHDVPVVWLQYVLLCSSLNAFGKGGIVFVLAPALSWALSAGWAALLSRIFDMVGQRVMTNQPQ